jgi:ribosome biogenesis GTPase A
VDLTNGFSTIDSSDVLLCVLDARDPLGTRCLAVEEYLRKEAPHKHLVFVLNKVSYEALQRRSYLTNKL